MSWITGLADKAEDILNKIDQNAASALQSPVKDDVGDGHRNTFSTGSLSFVKSLAPKQLPVLSDHHDSQLPDQPPANSNDSEQHSRRNSISWRPGAVAIDMESYKENLTPDTELPAFKIALDEVSNEREDPKVRLPAVEDVNQQAALADMEILISRLTSERNGTQKELADCLAANQRCLHLKSELEASITKLQQDYIEVSQKLQMQIEETSQQRHELAEYRKKAQLALRMKDQTIAELKSTYTRSADQSDGPAPHFELGTLQEENQRLLKELYDIQLEMQNLKSSVHSVNLQYEDTIRMLRLNDESLRKDVRVEKEHSLQLESELRVVNQELVATRQQISTQFESFSKELKDKDEQLENMKTRLSAARSNPNDNETRLRSLTDALVEKQNTVETILAERNAYRIQLEKLEGQLRAMEYNSRPPERNSVTPSYPNDAKMECPTLMRENPFDNRVARRVKRAYSTLDSAGIRLGVFLRRYPLIRIVVIVYIGLLHFWVMFVLFFSTPT